MATRAGLRIGRMVSRAVGQQRLEIPAGGGRQLRGSTSSTKRLALFYNTLDKPRRDNLTQVGVENAIAAEAAAGTLTWSEAQKNGCFNHRSGKDDQQLAFMRDYLYAFSFLPGNDAVLLRHWLNHYTVGTGVRPDHLAFATTASQARGHGWGEHVAALRQAGVAARQVKFVNDTYSDGLKLSVINAHIASLPLDAWLLVCTCSRPRRAGALLVRAAPPSAPDSLRPYDRYARFGRQHRTAPPHARHFGAVSTGVQHSQCSG